MSKQSRAGGRQAPKRKPTRVADETRASKSELNKLKRQLARLDRQLVEVLNERATLAAKIGALNQGGSEIEHFGKLFGELQKVHQGPLSDVALRAMFRELVSGCVELSGSLRVGYLGPLHSYSHLAAMERFGQSAELVPVGTIAGVFEDVAQGNLDFGLVPLENSTDGRIVDTLDMFVRVSVKISGEVPLRIHHCLLGSGPRGGIKRVCSKPQALSQCRGWLAKQLPSVILEETASTAVAAELAAQNADVAAIASREAAVAYGLKVLAAKIEDNKSNITRFAVIGQQSAPRSGRDKTSLLLQVAHEPGALADVMSVFRRNRLNLTWIESFPMSGQPQEYLFFVELEGHETDLRVRRAITAVEKKTQRLEILGAYPISEPVG